MSSRQIEPYLDVLSQNVKANRELIVLSILTQKSLCGTDLIKEIFSMTSIFLCHGTVFPILYSFEKEGLIQAVHEKGDMRAKIYHITPKGQEIAKRKRDDFIRATSLIIDLAQKGIINP